MSIPESEVVASLGRLTDDEGVEILSWVREAAISESGRFLAAGDDMAPYVRVLDLVEGQVWAFGSDGDGPGELRHVRGLEFVGDSTLLLLSQQRLERFTVDGEWRGGELMSEYGLRAMSIATGCGEEVFVYGVPAAHATLDSVPWLHELDMTDTPSASSRLVVPGRAGGSVRDGALFGVGGTDDGVFVWHRQVQSGLEAGYWVPCDQSSPFLLDHTAGDAEVSEAFLVGGEQVVSYTLPDTLFAGAAAEGSTAVRAFRWTDEGEDVTSMRVLGDGRCHMLELNGHWTLFDMRLNMIAFAQDEPFPRVALINWNWVEENLTERPCVV